MDIKKHLGNKIKLLRLEKSYSQEELAYKAAIDRTYISDIEKGERNVSILIIEKLEQLPLLHLKLIYFFLLIP